jgi:hypothetical protein
MRLQLLAVDDAGRQLITALGGKAPAALKADAGKPSLPSTPSKPSITPLSGMKAAPAPFRPAR